LQPRRDTAPPRPHRRGEPSSTLSRVSPMSPLQQFLTDALARMPGEGATISIIASRGRNLLITAEARDSTGLPVKRAATGTDIAAVVDDAIAQLRRAFGEEA